MKRPATDASAPGPSFFGAWLDRDGGLTFVRRRHCRGRRRSGSQRPGPSAASSDARDLARSSCGGGRRDRIFGGITLNATHQNRSPDSLAALPAGLALPNGRRILTTQQFASAIVPVGGPTGIHLTGTFIWGALNDFENEPFPW